jgi:hypothetical protein
VDVIENASSEETSFADQDENHVAGNSRSSAILYAFWDIV